MCAYFPLNCFLFYHGVDSLYHIFSYKLRIEMGSVSKFGTNPLNILPIFVFIFLYECLLISIYQTKIQMKEPFEIKTKQDKKHVTCIIDLLIVAGHHKLGYKLTFVIKNEYKLPKTDHINCKTYDHTRVGCSFCILIVYFIR